MGNTELGKIIRQHRKNAGLTQKQLAKKLGKAESTVRMWELGKNTPPLDTLKEIGSTLEIPLGDLLIEAGYIEEFQKMVLENMKKPPEVPTFGEAIINARNDVYDEDDNPVDVPLSEIAKKSNISEEILKRIEDGEDIRLTDLQLLELAKALDVTFAYLFLLSRKDFDLINSEMADNLIIRLSVIRYSDMEKIISMTFEEFYELEDKSVIGIETAQEIYNEYLLAKKIDKLARLFAFSDIVTNIADIKDLIMSPVFELKINNRKLSQNDRKKIVSKIDEIIHEFEYEE